MKAALALLLALVVAALGAIGWLELRSTAAHSTDTALRVSFEVPRGASGQRIGELLADQGLIDSPMYWRWHLMRRGGLKANAGMHELGPGMTLPEIASQLEKPTMAAEIPFVVVEGYRIADTDAALVAAGLIDPGEYIAAARDPSRFTAAFPLPTDSLEGYLYPETYRVGRERADVYKLIQRQLELFNERFYAEFRDELEKSGRTLHEIVVMASMLEREEPVPAQRPLVAGILWKRIDNGVPLGVDATSRYELAQWNDRKAFLKRLRDPSDIWNSRHRKGLPPGAIGAPTVSSLVASLRPVKSEYWYYLHDADRRLHPSRNGAEHEALRRKYNVY
ncbi:MAG TPA: endolytic transglycosylase MltG [Myxococcaceae bacterium]|nr:endolytic transglycosylase MltG [Myxococcaceae bacterium]